METSPLFIIAFEDSFFYCVGDFVGQRQISRPSNFSGAPLGWKMVPTSSLAFFLVLRLPRHRTRFFGDSSKKLLYFIQCLKLR